MLLVVKCFKHVLCVHRLLFVVRAERVGLGGQVSHKNSGQVDDQVLRLGRHFDIFRQFILDDLTYRSYIFNIDFNLLFGKVTS